MVFSSRWYHRKAWAIRKRCSERKGLVSTIKGDDLRKAVHKYGDTCPRCIEPFDQSTSLKRRSIDRIDANIGYTPENIQIICYSCNSKKGVETERYKIVRCKKKKRK